MDFNSIPGIELHLHAEGAIPREYLWERRVAEDPTLTRAEFESEFNYSDFKDFVKLWCKYQNLLFSIPQTYSNYERATARGLHPAPIEILPVLAQSLRQHNLSYVELHISPIDACYMTYGKQILDSADFYTSIVKAWQVACDQWNTLEGESLTIKLILDLVRNYPQNILDFQMHNLRNIRAELTELVAVGLGGGDDSKSLLDFNEAFREVRALDLGLVVHAGEHLPKATASREISEAISLKVDRIGHGIHGYADHLEKLQESQIALEICPTSNLVTGSVNKMVEHPLMDMLNAGINCVIGSDDPTYFETNFWDEMQIAVDMFVQKGFLEDLSEIQCNNSLVIKLLKNSIDASYASAELKNKLKSKLDLGSD